jgi:predicted CoA-substrate-specific enzyme activase
MVYCGGIDIGASATKAAVIDDSGALVGSAVLRSGVDFALSARRAFDLALAEAGISAGQVTRVFSCGYGRDNVAFAQATRTEIATHAAAAFHHFPRALTVLDIGGQDNKVIRLDAAGRRVSFKMNRKCAAGTGAFLEEMALRLNVGIEEFDALARSATGEVALGSYCTVFSATEVLAHIRAGVALADLVKGLFRSVLKRVMEMDSLSDTVVMTGGVAAHNPFLVEMLAETLGHEVLLPPKPQLAGAHGAALLAQKDGGSLAPARP